VAFVAGGVPDASAQISTGSLYGKITDPSGAVMPGATVTLKGANIRPMTTVTGSQGEYRFASLDNGSYTVGVTLTGLPSMQRQVTVTTGVNTEVNFSIKVASVEETITVTAETPVIDTKKLGTGTTIDSDELSKIPNSRDPWAFLRTVPGVQIDRLNQAGTERAPQTGNWATCAPRPACVSVLRI